MSRLLTLMALSGLSAASFLAPSADTTAVVHALVLDSRQAQILNLTAEDFVVREDGKTKAIISVSPATRLMHVMVLVDDNGTGIFRYGLNGFAELLQGRAELALRVVTNQVERVFDFTADPKIWFAGLSRAGVRPATPEGGQLLEGIFEAARTFRTRETHHAAILALTVGGNEQSPRQSRQVLDELRRSRAALHVIFVDNPTSRPSGAVTKPTDLLEGNFNLGKVLGDGPKESGGRRHEVLAMNTLQAEVQRVARDLLNQYEIRYLRTDGDRAERLEVTVKNSALRVVAPTRSPLDR